jgi:kinesin family protein C2/C3
MSSIVECLLALRDNVTTGLGENLSNYAAKTPTRHVAPISTPGRRSPGEDRRRSLWDAKSPQRSPLHSGMCSFLLLLDELACII